MQLNETKAAIWNGKKFELRETTIYHPEESTIVKVTGAGFCGTDKHMLAHANLAKEKSLGHEIFGEIVRIGKKTNSLNGAKLNIGDRVIVTPGVPCNSCHICLSYGNHDNLCNHRRAHGFSVYNSSNFFPIGGFSNYIELLDDLWVVRVPDDISTERAMFAEPLAIAVKAVERALSGTRCDRDFGPGVAMRAAVVGLGPIGCSIVYILKSLGAQVLGIDINQKKAEHVSRVFGIQTSVVPENSDEAYEMIRSSNKGSDFDVVIESAGYPKAFELCIHLARKGGKVVEVGHFVPGSLSEIDPAIICRKELDIVGAALAPAFSYSKVFRLLQQENSIDLESLVTHNFKLSNLNSILDLIQTNDYIKIHINTQE
ncbi:MAG: zinc-binding dehydrogenase [Parachlamydiaceae bacterium]